MFFLMEFKFTYRNVITYMVKMKNQKEIKRFAGHSKWANIKRTKMQTDLKKSQLIQMTLKKIKYAVDINKNTDPDKNIMLARAIAEAKRNSIPAATITNALKNLTISLNQNSVTYISRGPLNILIILQLLSNQAECRLKINGQLKKLGFSSCEIPKAGLLNEEGVILTEQLYSYQEEEKIIEDAIDVGAADAKIIKKNNEEFCQVT
ncbi:PREDICTED: translational activator of cytochrome c oxidase 1 [Ceratosolen solmsi marchali]|uniref:Translational activator of cytochrome c oxidase 1 n=1 Tax=Ceratosolen solmsi marchali TaxID=326594 RepID=A0AAJ6YFF0_9HYME|nr:PREDICTED: translational activator of cytochrome c oxidase 1 [Ceratosolen solmsi marchali]